MNRQQSKSPLKLQLVIQGGGAKISALLAAMEAVQKLQAADVIKVTRIAGTSAGAIVGALFAAGVDIAIVRKRLQKVTPYKLARLFPAPGIKWATVTRLGRGRPLWRSDFLMKELQQFLEPTGGVLTFSDLQRKGTELLVVATNLSESGKMIHGTLDKDGKAPERPVIEALLDSSGLPFCFRTWNKDGTHVIVDGGICENLPADELLPDEAKDGLVIGITFANTRGRVPSTFKNFSIALLDAAINNSMSRAKLRLGTGRFHPIATRIGTFDFESALNEGLADLEYDRVQKEATEFFQELVSEEQSKEKQIISHKAWTEQSTLMMSTLGEVYKKQHEKSKLHYKACSVIVEANSLAGDDNAEDYVRYRMAFETLDDPIYCHALSLSETGDHETSGRSEVTVLDPKGMPIEMRKVPIRDPAVSTGTRLLLFFIPPLKAKTGPYTMNVKDVVRDAVKPLRESQKDELAFTPLRALGSIDQIDLIVRWPRGSGMVEMHAKEGATNGHLMSNDELAEYAVPAELDQAGWRGNNIDSGQEFGVDLKFIQEK